MYLKYANDCIDRWKKGDESLGYTQYEFYTNYIAGNLNID